MEEIKWELTIRKVPLSTEAKLSRKGKLRWLALSLGLINPRESRSGVLAVLDVLIDGLEKGIALPIEEISRQVSQKHPMSEKNVYYHIKRLKEMGLVEKTSEGYILGDGEEKHLSSIIRKIYEKRLGEVMEKVDAVASSLHAQ